MMRVKEHADKSVERRIAKVQAEERVRQACWIIGLSAAALLIACQIANGSIDYYKRFYQANRLATGHVIESGVELSDGDSDGHYEGVPQPWSDYEFKVGKKVYEG